MRTAGPLVVAIQRLTCRIAHGTLAQLIHPENEMRQPSVTDSQLLMLFELCLDAEDRCDERSREARARGDHESADRESQLESRYKSLRNRLFIAMKEDPTASMLEQLTQEVMEAGKLLAEQRLPAEKDLPPTGGGA